VYRNYGAFFELLEKEVGKAFDFLKGQNELLEKGRKDHLEWKGTYTKNELKDIDENTLGDLYEKLMILMA